MDAGGALWVGAATLTVALRSSGAAALSMCGASLTGRVSIEGTSGPTVIGAVDENGDVTCAGNTFTGSVSVTGNTGGVSFTGNTVKGSLAMTGNSGSP